MSTGTRRLGRYELQERLGSGSMDEVWRAFDTQLHRPVAIRLLHADYQLDPDFVTRFEREARIVASLHHPNIVQIHEFHVSHPEVSGSPTAYMVMEYIEGQTLAAYLHTTSHKRKFPPVADLVQLLASISVAIDYAHQKGVIHCNITPESILLDSHNTLRNRIGEPLLTGFGIAQLLGKSTGFMSGGWYGSPTYMSPEQVQGQPGNERSDLYSLGVILYELCTGVPPFQRDNPATIMRQHVNEQPPSPVRINPAIPPSLASVILHSLAKNPEARFPSASAMAIAVAQALDMPIPDILDASVYATDPTKAPTYTGSPQAPRPSNGTPFIGLPTPVVPVSQPLQPPMVSATPPAPQAAPLSPVDSISHASTLVQPHHGTSVPAQFPSPTRPPASPAKKSHRKWLVALSLVLLLLLSGSGLWAFLGFPHGQPTAPTIPIVGHAFFVSSGQLNDTSSQGNNDQMQIDLHGISAPHSGNSYYAWLLSDKQQKPTQFLLLGVLPVTQGSVHFLYMGDQQHNNLIAKFSRLLITEESANSLPHIPSSDSRTWRYYAELPQIPSPFGRHTAAVNNLRDMLYEGPNLQAIGIHGGTDINIFRGTQKIVEWAGSARGDWTTRSADLMHRHFIRILDYLDGARFVQQDVPPGTALLVNSTIAQIPLLDVTADQNPRSYIDRLNDQLIGLIRAPGLTPQMHALAIQTQTALTKNLPFWLGKVRQDAKQLVMMNHTQLLQLSTLALLDDMLMQALYAFIGQLNPDTSQIQAGAVQIHYNVQRLATLDVKPYSGS